MTTLRVGDRRTQLAEDARRLEDVVAPPGRPPAFEGAPVAGSDQAQAVEAGIADDARDGADVGRRFRPHEHDLDGQPVA